MQLLTTGWKTVTFKAKEEIAMEIKSELTLDFHYDAGHGWIEVPKAWIRDLGLRTKISSCSYEKGQNVYLEEDCDASTFIKAYKEVAQSKGIEVKMMWNEISDGDDSPIRRYKSYDCEGK